MSSVSDAAISSGIGAGAGALGGAAAAGLGLAPATGGLSLAIPLITAGVSGLFSLFSGHQQANATKQAAATQAATSAAALAEQKRIFDLQRADRAPYVSASLGALGNAQNVASMGHYMPLPAQQLGASSQPAPLGPPQMGMMPNSQSMSPKMMLGQLGQPQQPQGGNEPMGMFRAPDGSTRQLPLRLEQELATKQVRRIQ